MGQIQYDINILPQPTETTCGPTCLHSLYAHLGLNVSLEEVIDSVLTTRGGGTLGPLLALDAINRGLEARIYTHNLNVFDPSWFKLTKARMIEKLSLQATSKKLFKVKESSEHYAEFLKTGGDIFFKNLDADFLLSKLKDSGPMICGLSATYLYMSQREIGDTCEYDDINGYPQGHFVILKGMSEDQQIVTIADPMATNPLTGRAEYEINTQHFINSLLVGVITYDANFILINKPKDKL